MKEQGAQATVADKPFQATNKNTTVALVDLLSNPWVFRAGFGGAEDSGRWFSMLPWSILARQGKL